MFEESAITEVWGFHVKAPTLTHFQFSPTNMPFYKPEVLIALSFESIDSKFLRNILADIVGLLFPAIFNFRSCLDRFKNSFRLECTSFLAQRWFTQISLRTATYYWCSSQRSRSTTEAGAPPYLIKLDYCKTLAFQLLIAFRHFGICMYRNCIYVGAGAPYSIKFKLDQALRCARSCTYMRL